MNKLKDFVKEPFHDPTPEDRREQFAQMIKPESVITRLSLKERKKLLEKHLKQKKGSK